MIPIFLFALFKARLDLDPSTEIRLKAYRYYSPNDNYITVTMTTEQPRVNEPMEFHVKTSQQVPEIFYEVGNFSYSSISVVVYHCYSLLLLSLFSVCLRLTRICLVDPFILIN